MKRYWLIFGLGVFVALAPQLGLPRALDEVLFLIVGMMLAFVALSFIRGATVELFHPKNPTKEPNKKPKPSPEGMAVPISALDDPTEDEPVKEPEPEETPAVLSLSEEKTPSAKNAEEDETA